MSGFKLFYIDDDESSSDKNSDIEKFFKSNKIIKWQAISRSPDNYPVLLVEFEESQSDSSVRDER